MPWWLVTIAVVGGLLIGWRTERGFGRLLDDPDDDDDDDEDEDEDEDDSKV